MCGIFGYLYYGKEKLSGNDVLARALGWAVEERGGHATGVSFVDKGKMVINKDAVSAYMFDFNIPDGIKCVMGHTRFTTQGSEKVNINNHPFPGSTKNVDFAFAHNGVLMNDSTLRTKMAFKTDIETDSYIGAQLLEFYGKVDFEGMRWMAEQISGSFVFTVLDTLGNLWIIKKDNPCSILHFKEYGLYAYCSTKSNLIEAMMDTSLHTDLYSALRGDGNVELLTPEEGSIWKIDSKGKITKETFKPLASYYRRSYYTYNYDYDSYYNSYTRGNNTTTADNIKYYTKKQTDPLMTTDDDDYETKLYIAEIYALGEKFGYKREDIELVYTHGYGYEDILYSLEYHYFDDYLKQAKEAKAEYDNNDDEEDVYIEDLGKDENIGDFLIEITDTAKKVGVSVIRVMTAFISGKVGYYELLDAITRDDPSDSFENLLLRKKGEDIDEDDNKSKTIPETASN